MIELNLIQLISALIGTGGAGALIIKLFDYFILKPKERLDTYPNLIKQIQTSLIDPLKSEVSLLHEDVRVLRAKVNIYENHLMKNRQGELLVERTRKQFLI